MARTIRTPAQKAKEKLVKKAAETARDDLLPPKPTPVQLATTQIDNYDEREPIPYVSLEDDENEADPADDGDDYLTMETMDGEIHRIRRTTPAIGFARPAQPQRYSLMTQRSDDGFEVRMMPNDEGRFDNNEIASAMQTEMERLFEEMQDRRVARHSPEKTASAIVRRWDSTIAVTVIIAVILAVYFR